MAIEIKQEYGIRELVKRFEAILSGFAEQTSDRGCRYDRAYLDHAISKAILRYIKSYAESHTSIQLIGMNHPTSLASIYISQKFCAYTSIRSFESVDDMEESFTRALQRSAYCKGNNLLGLNLANEEEYLMVLGLPAAGKTTFLKYIGSEALRYPKSRYKYDLLPVFLPMRRFCSNTDTLLLAIAEEFERCGFPEPQELAIWMLERGELLILIDGLNESVLSHKQLSHLVTEFVSTYPRNRYIVSSRLNCYENSLGQFLEVELLPWGDLHVQEYIHKWCTVNQIGINGLTQETKQNAVDDPASEAAQRCWKLLQINDIARELAKSPLSLSLLCLLLCDRRYSVPSNVSGLYKKSINLILEEQVIKQHLNCTEVVNNLSTDILELILIDIAYRGFEKHQLEFTLEVITNYLQDLLGNYLQKFQELSIPMILEVFQQLGICKIVNSIDGMVFTFSHIAFQEYFVALYVYRHHKTKSLVTHHLSDRHWQNVFLFLAGMSNGNVEELLLDMEAQVTTYINQPKLNKLLVWLERSAAYATGNLKDVSKRIVALFVARPRFLTKLAPALSLMRVLTIARKLYEMFDASLDFDRVFEAELSLSLSHALDFDSVTEINLATQLCNQLEQALVSVEFDSGQINFQNLRSKLDNLYAQAPNYEQSIEVREQFRSQISLTWAQTLYLPLDSNHLSLLEIENLENYLYANLLMVQCKNAAIAISPVTWNKIESRIFRVAHKS
ncbi:NACHT domain-containing NTPase [Pseudanabaena sp. 'Roaring Creek']|uniref:NACHT domain-containing protein n=1 Tax=Pseudanabaena sp. 'Roaring Creek' TaxID=1681830 RepID=UPI0006D82DE1|nr:NACHT domain-containing protein [Pseudanabaena sp. 'Roaring Creek']